MAGRDIFHEVQCKPRCCGWMWLAVLLIVLAPDPALAAQDMQLRVYAGFFDTKAWIDGDGTETMEAGVELRGAPIADTPVAPLIGTTANTDDASLFYLGLSWSHWLTSGWQTAMSFAFARYEQGESRELGNDLEFRSGIEIAHPFTGGYALGMQFYHISNAGLSDLNPGNNSLVLFYNIPIR
ncbi:MAG: acyloxyacyl hydrolase [Gammaproteobacteria bacterium]|nr:acyloxyacyl hydrolase [Gammaproteobacteria bacterium]